MIRWAADAPGAPTSATIHVMMNAVAIVLVKLDLRARWEDGREAIQQWRVGAMSTLPAEGGPRQGGGPETW